MFDITTKIKSKKQLLTLSFLLPFIIMGIIYAMMGVYPFGNNTLLTVDLGQQYVDFFSYFRHTLFNEPSALFYSFAKGIGGDMVGLWSYYLNSPFNLLLLFTPDRFLPVGVTLLILLKIASSGLSFAYLLIKKFNGETILVPIFALSYALMGYTIVNQLNVMWLDGMVFLPLIVLGLEKIIDGENGVFYSLMLGITLFANYYIAYMICLFLILYFLFSLMKQTYTKELTWPGKISFLFKRSCRFAWYSLIGAALAAFSLLPNFFSLLGSKASYMTESVDWSLKYPFQEILSKFYIGAFDFDQMPSGHPNLFVGTIAIISFILYLSKKEFPKKERFIALLITVFLFLSMNVNILNKVWHGMQYPIWYPYRFSFVVSFFFILNGFRALQKLNSLSLWFACALLLLQTLSAIYVLGEDFSFVIPLQVLISTIIIILVLTLLLLWENKYDWLPYALILIAVVELSTNAAINLTRLSYVKMKPFNDYQLVLDEFLAPIRPVEDEFYRIEKVFQRSKNDSFQANYPSATHFSSTFETEVPHLYGLLGFPEGNGFVSYSTGTMLTDALFGIRYIGENKPLPDNLANNKAFYNLRQHSYRPDLNHYPIAHDAYRSRTYLNNHAFSLGFAVPETMKRVSLRNNQPVDNQEKILDALSNQFYSASFFEEVEISSTSTKNISSGLQGSLNRTYTKKDTDEDAYVELQFTTETDDPYYLVIDSRIDDDNANFLINGEDLQYYATYRNDQVINLASGEADQTVRFTFELLEDDLKIRDLKLYRFDLKQFEEVVAERQENFMTLTSFSQTNIKGSITVQDDSSVFMTTFPHSVGWKLEVDGKEVETYTVLDTFLAADIEPGDHQIELSYRTPYFFEGVLVSLGSLLIVLITMKKTKRPLKKLV